MQGTDQDSGGAQLSVGWQDGVPEPGDHGLEQAASYAALLTRTLAAAGYLVRRLDVGARRGAQGILEITVHGDVPRMDEADFASLARVTLNAARLADDTHGANDVVLLATLRTIDAARYQPDQAGNGHVVVAPVAVPSTPPEPARGVFGSLPLGRLIVGLVLGLVLGVLGLPRFELPFAAPATTPPRSVVVIPDVPTPAALSGPASPRELLAADPPIPTAVPTRLPTQTPPPRVVVAQQMTTPLPNWPNNPAGPAWFGDGGYHLFAREAGRFVALGIPMPQIVNTAVLTAEFRKVGGAAGGGYGFIIRDQGSTSERDGRNQAGKYMVLEVGDRGDVGIWQRNETRWIDVMPWTHSDLVHTDQGLNALVIMLRGNAVRFEVNGEAVADLTYDGIGPQGGVGLFVGGDLNEVVLEWLRIEIS
jgi:hypothetical protein